MLPNKTAVANRLLTCLLIFFSFTLPGYAQLQANFTADKTGGCSPLTVNFTNASLGVSQNAVYSWDFGNGNSSPLSNTGAVFTTEKSYTVTLTVTDAGKTSAHSMIITVYKKPTIDFTSNVIKGCLPLDVNFIANGQAGDGFLSSYYWDFGDGSTLQQTAASVVHTYSTKQPATVSLTAKNNYGCHTTVVKKDLIQVLPSIVADFEADKKVLCAETDPVVFTNKSRGPGTLSYLWDFGNGQTSTETNPSYSFNTKGTYTVKLTVNNSEGCSDTEIKTNYLNIANYTADIQFPPLVCVGMNFNVTSTYSPNPDKLEWRLDGAPYSGWSSTDLIFYTPGTHTLEFIATFGTCQKVVARTFEVKDRPSTQYFSTDIKNICVFPTLVEFKDTSSEGAKWEWDFNYEYFNPEVNATTKETSYTYTLGQPVNIRLRLFNAAGCYKDLVQQIDLSPPRAQIVRIDPNPYLDVNACGPVTLSFKSISQENIVKYTWVFDNNPIWNSSLPEPTHTFTGIGNHSVRLEFETDKGCKGFSYYNYNIYIRAIPHAGFTSQSGTTICGNTRVFFQSERTDVYINEYWYINGVYTGSSYYSFFDHQFSDTGSYTIQLIADNNGCRDTMTKVDYIKVLAPFPKITNVKNSCEDRGLVVFSQDSRYGAKWIWDYGDGKKDTLNTNQPTISHNYSSSGEYKVVLTVTNGQCSVRDSFMTYVFLKPTPLLASNKTEICPSEPLEVTISNLPAGPYPYVWVYYYFVKWEYGDGTTFNGNDQNNWSNFVNPLPYTGRLTGFDPAKDSLRVIIVESIFGCQDTSNYIPVKIKGAIAGYRLLNNDICFNDSLLLEDTSYANVGGAIKSREWDFGDGQKLITYQGGIVKHKYSNPGQYQVTLKITDDVGCVSTTNQNTQYAKINGPKASIGASATVVPLNSTVFFYSNSNDYSNYRATFVWDLGNGQTATGSSAQRTFATAGTYTVKLTATDPVTGCTSETTKEITVQPVNGYFTFTKSFIGQSNCLPLLARFSVVTINADSLSWDFGDGTTAGDVKYPSHVYDRPGKYIVKLTVHGANGLKIDYIDSLVIKLPQVNYTTNAWEGCPGHTVNWNLNGTDNSSYVWDFGDGHTGTANDGSTAHPYAQAGTFYPTLLLKDSNGCMITAGITDKVIIHPNPAINISPATASACLGQPLQLTADGAQTYVWTPATGLDNPQSATPFASPLQTTTYTVEGTDTWGCRNKKDYTLTVHHPFTVQLTLLSEICEGKSIKLNASGADHYNWINTTAGLDNLQTNAPVASPSKTTEYTVVGYDKYGCFSDTANVMVNVHPLPLVDAGKDVEIQVGETVQLSAKANLAIARWNWSPPTSLSCITCASPVSAPQSEMKYKVTATTEFGCEASDEVIIKLQCAETRVRIPNAFTPNGDGKNDLFEVKGISLIKHIVIYNRWGNKVFERTNFIASDPSSCWDGNLKGMMQPTGTYAYMIEMQCPTGETFIRKGTVTLIR